MAAPGVPGYVFTSPGVGTDFYVDPIVDRTQLSRPPRLHVTLLSPVADFYLRGYGIPVRVKDLTPGAFILLTTASQPTAGPPSNVTPSSSDNVYSAVAGYDGVANFKVPAGYSYYLNCWIPVQKGQTWSYRRGSPPNFSTGLANIAPLATIAPIAAANACHYP